MLQSAAQRNQILQSPGNEGQASVVVVLQSLLSDNESQASVVVVLQSLLSDISLSIVVDDASRTASVLQQVEGSR